MREDRAAGRGETQTAGNRNGAEGKEAVSARAVLTSSPQTIADNRGGWEDARQGMTARTHTYGIMATTPSHTD